MSKEEQRSEIVRDIRDLSGLLPMKATFGRCLEGQSIANEIAVKFQQLQMLKETETKEQNENQSK